MDPGQLHAANVIRLCDAVDVVKLFYYTYLTTSVWFRSSQCRGYIHEAAHVPHDLMHVNLVQAPQQWMEIIRGAWLSPQAEGTWCEGLVGRVVTLQWMVIGTYHMVLHG